MPSMAIAADTTPGRKLPSHSSIGGKQGQEERATASVSIETEHPFLFCTQSQLCLALNIMKSKPADINTRGTHQTLS